jgi:regulator of nonsense transcripts 2
VVSRKITDLHGYALLYLKEPSKALESSLKRHTALIKRIRQSIGLDHREQILKDIETLTLEKYIDEIAGAVPDGIVRCKLEKDVWSATEVRHQGGHNGTHDF